MSRQCVPTKLSARKLDLLSKVKLNQEECCKGANLNLGLTKCGSIHGYPTYRKVMYAKKTV